MSATFGVAPSNDDKFLTIEALRLEPCAPVGLVPTTGAFRDDAFKAVLAGKAMEGRTLPELMVVVPEPFRRTLCSCSIAFGMASSNHLRERGGLDFCQRQDEGSHTTGRQHARA